MASAFAGYPLGYVAHQVFCIGEPVGWMEACELDDASDHLVDVAWLFRKRVGDRSAVGGFRNIVTAAGIF